MTSAQIRQSFLDFFRSKQHTIVPSSSLMPDAPNLLFTNAGMNQFVPLFLGQKKADVSKWAGAVPGSDTRAADTQKCIRAGGKHNDLDDVGLDTYHHTFFEMLGNWSFGDYFKQEAIEWAWELVVQIWKFPPSRLYATVYSPDKSKGDPSDFDQEAWNHWAGKFRAAGLDPAVHVVNGGKKDNFWMMGETGPCGPCSELHVDLTPAGDTRGALVNQGDARCIEIWNLVFIQFNANPDGTFSPLPAKHVDTGMGFERVTSIIQGTKGLADFANAKISNYETDIFRPIFDELEKLSGKKYASTLPTGQTAAVWPSGTVPAAKTAGFEAKTAVPLPSGANPAARGGDLAAHGGHPAPSGGGSAPLGIHPAPHGGDPMPRGAGPAPHGDALPASSGVAPATAGTHPAAAGMAPTLAGMAPAVAGSGSATCGIGIAASGMGGATSGTGSAPSGTHPAAVGTAPAAPGIDPVPSGAGGASSGIAAAGPGNDPKIAIDIAFRVIADHIRTLSFAIADGIQPGNTDRHYVLRRILRRAVRYGRTLGFHEPFFYKLVDVLAATMGDVFPEIRARKKQVQEVIQREEEAFNKTLDEGLKRFEQILALQVKFDRLHDAVAAYINQVAKFLDVEEQGGGPIERLRSGIISRDPISAFAAFWIPSFSPDEQRLLKETLGSEEAGLIESAKELGRYCDKAKSWTSMFRSSEGNLHLAKEWQQSLSAAANLCVPMADRVGKFRGRSAFLLYDTYGFPLDLTELMARERGLSVDTAGFEKLMEEQRARARAAQKKTVVELSQVETTTPTQFIGYDKLETPAKVLEVVSLKDKTAVILDTSACYAEMGGQVGDTGEITGSGQLWRITNTQKSGNTWLHLLASEISNSKSQIADAPAVGATVTLSVEKPRRAAIERHHTVTHLLHWALHEVASRDATQKGSFVGPDKLTFDFNSAPLTPAQVADIEKLVNERILENASVFYVPEVPYSEVKGRTDVMQFFGDKYGDTVRVVQIGGEARALNGYSMELCGGTHTRATGEIGLFRITGENAIAAGVRRIEAIAGLTAFDAMRLDRELIRTVAGKVNSPVGELEKKIDALLAHQKELEKQLKAASQRDAANSAKSLLARAETLNGTPAIIAHVPGADGDTLQTIADALKAQFKGVIVLGGASGGAVALVAAVTPDFTARVQAGKIIQTIAPIVGGKGGGKPDHARGGGKDASKLDEALAKARSLLG